MRVGSNEFVYEEVKGWGQFPKDWNIKEIADVAVDSQDRVFIFTRGEHPVIIMDTDGKLIATWGEGIFTRPHSAFIGPDDSVYCVDDRGHAIRKFTPDGNLLMTIETTEHPADTGYVLNRPETVLRSGPPFNRPTALALSPNGDLYVSDGYGNARVHRFSPDGRLLASWGDPGSGPGQFNVPHGICVDENGLVYVSDRLNKRVQIFDSDGSFISQWKGVHYPNAMRLDSHGNVYLAEMGGVYLDWPEVHLERLAAQVSVRDLTGRVLAEWGEQDPLGDGRYFSPHGIAVDSRGDLYLGEIPVTYTHGAAPDAWPRLRKYIRV